ncbi:MAG: metal-binding protein [Candidatus Melainabacteria bacterium]|nr:metal-binding protein [Candidatus Melainabacteria bacterium]
MKVYSILKGGQTIKSTTPGTLAGWGPGKIFGRLDCKSGIRMKKENRVFFHTLEDAVTQDFRPCKKCKPIDEDDFEEIRHLVPYKSLVDFYNRDSK